MRTSPVVRIVYLSFFLIFSLQGVSQSVVINEVVTDPQQDWEGGGFTGTIGGGTATQGTDEWVELYITVNGEDLTNWTIEVTDGGFFSGDLTSRDVTGTGAFQTTVYFGSGSFTNTQAGDYLVLGNPQSSESIVNDAFIVLRDETSAIIDDVEIGDDDEGDGTGDGAPYGGAAGGLASGVDDEAIARIPNGTDTDNDVNDFEQLAATLGTENGLSTVYVDAAATDDEGTGTMSDPKQTIQTGENMALTNGTVIVVAGTYSESVTINTTGVTIQGANSGTPASSTRVAESIVNPASSANTITINATGVTIDGIQIGASSVSSNATTAVLDDGNNNVTINNNIIYANTTGIDFRNISSGTVRATDNLVDMLDLEDQTNPGNASFGFILSALTGTVDAELATNSVQDASFGIFGYNVDNGADPLLIDGGIYTGCMKGIEIDNADGGGGFAPSEAQIQNVTMSAFAGPDTDVFAVPGPQAQAGVYSFVSGSGAATDDVDLTVSGVDISGTGNTQSDFSAVYMAGFASAGGPSLTTSVTNSNLHDNLNRGVYIRGETTTATISQCTITGNGFDPTGTGGNPGFSIISRVSATTNVTNCTITNAASQTGFTTAGLASDVSATMTVTDCSITNNGNGTIALGFSGAALDLSRNWLGSTDEATIAGLVGTIAEVDLTPWIGSGTDTDGGTMGFQPDLSTLYVGTSGTQTGGTGRWQEGHNLVDASGTLILAHSDYAETVTVNKSVTFQPTTSGTDTSLDDLVMNGSSSTLTLDGNLLIDNAVTLTDGIINVNSGELRLGTSASNITESAASRITGRLTMDPRAVGIGGINLLGVNIVADAFDDLGNVTIVRDSGTGAIITDGPNTSIAASWDITVDTQPINAGRTVTFTWRSEFDNGKDMTMISAFRNAGAGWVEIGGPFDTSASDPRSVTLNGVTQFSQWSMAQDDEPLPVELSAFGATSLDSYILLSWTTLVEINADHFVVEKSVDGAHFNAGGSVSANGNTNEKMDYSWEDKAVNRGRTYYRLKMVDVDGTFEFSKVISAVPQLTHELKVYPNPARDYLDLIYPQVPFHFYLFDQNGKVLRAEKSFSNRIDISRLRDGIYFLQVDDHIPFRIIVKD